ncbi:MAG: branched-chain amino acid transporter AzlC [Firmicutes bacterium]|nr:branched-chain amino acid transporter AzlC [Bacillota bacterium]
MEQKRKTIRYAFQSSLPIMAGYIVLGIGFGILLQNAGYSWLWAAAMSIAIYAGSMQYAAVELLTGGASLAAAALMTVFVNIRHLFYGIAMIEPYKDAGLKKSYLIFALTDETFSLVCAPQLPAGIDRKDYSFFVSLFNQIYWVTGCVIGAFLGDVIPFDTTGVDFVMTALFAVIFTEQWESASAAAKRAECKNKNMPYIKRFALYIKNAADAHIPAITGFTASLVCLLIFGADDFLIPSMALIAVLLIALRGKIEKTDTDLPADTLENEGGRKYD